MWNTFVYFNYSDSYRLLQYIGFDAKFGDCFRESNRKDSWAQVQKNIDRRTYHVAILTLKQVRKRIILDPPQGSGTVDDATNNLL